MVWIETPTNPTMKLVDIEAVSQLVHRKDPNIIVVVDNTYLSSYFQVLNPLLEFIIDYMNYVLL